VPPSGASGGGLDVVGQVDRDDRPAPATAARRADDLDRPRRATLGVHRGDPDRTGTLAALAPLDRVGQPPGPEILERAADEGRHDAGPDRRAHEPQHEPVDAGEHTEEEDPERDEAGQHRDTKAEETVQAAHAYECAVWRKSYRDDVLPQQDLIARVRELVGSDPGLEAAFMYGSFAAGVGDEYSDIEFWLYFRADVTVDPHVWCAQVAPLLHLVRNEFGTHVAFFDGLIRGEFHFATVDDIDDVRQAPARGAPVDNMIILDRSGRLRAALETVPEEPPLLDDPLELCGRLANWLLLAHLVRQRGEYLRAVDALGHAQWHLIWLARLATGHTEHWLTPSRGAEAELPTGEVSALAATFAIPESESLRRAIAAAWRLGRRYWTNLARRSKSPLPSALFDQLDRDLEG
jgi:lincosamide nucleotidyltransferase B/F